MEPVGWESAGDCVSRLVKLHVKRVLFISTRETATTTRRDVFDLAPLLFVSLIHFTYESNIVVF